MNESQRALALGNAVEDLSLADYQSYRMAIELLLGKRPRWVTLHRSPWKRLQDAISAAVAEFKAKERIVPVTSP